MKLAKRPRAIGFVLAVATMFLVLANQSEVGLARDEIVYMQNGMRYADWWIGLFTFDHGVSKDNITKTFGGKGPTDNNREHPPLVKTLSGLSHELFHDKLELLDEPTAFRLPSAALYGVCVYLVFSMSLAIWGLFEAVIAALVLAFLPRALFHASLVCFDAPVMTMWFACVYSYWRALDGRKWPWVPGVMFGLLLATKHNAVLLPFVFIAHTARLAFRSRKISQNWRIGLACTVLGPLTFIVVWPWLWFDTFDHVAAWLKFHFTHVHYNFEYLGDNWNAPPFPWHVALVTTLFTVPVVTLVGAGLGLARFPLQDERRTGLLLAFSALASMGPFFKGDTPIFGAEKHWMPALPTICIAAGAGIAWAARGLAARFADRHRAIVMASVATIVVGAAAVETVVAQPYALSWYNALAGGAPGGADLGMNRQFWGVAARGALPVVATQAPANGTLPVYSHDASPAWGFYQKLGLVPKSLPDSGQELPGIEKSKIALVIHEKHFNRHDYMIWKAYGTVQPAFVLRAAGVPIVSIYLRPK